MDTLLHLFFTTLIVYHCYDILSIHFLYFRIFCILSIEMRHILYFRIFYFHFRIYFVNRNVYFHFRSIFHFSHIFSHFCSSDFCMHFCIYLFHFKCRAFCIIASTCFIAFDVYFRCCTATCIIIYTFFSCTFYIC